MEVAPKLLKPIRWVGSSRKDLKTFPKDVQREIGQALYAVQRGEDYAPVKSLKASVEGPSLRLWLVTP